MQSTAAKYRLLLVDGDPKALRVLDVSLKKAGFHVASANNGLEALASIEAQVPDLIISDTHMPEMDGFELCRRIKQRPEWGKLPFIFLSGRKSIEEKIRGLELGVEDYLTKPIYIKEITTRVRMLLQRAQRARLESRREDRTKFAGQLSDIGVVDLVQTIEINRKSGIIHIVNRDTRRGAIYFRDGQVIDAEAGRLSGPEALYRLFSWGDGSFEVDFKPIRRKDVIELAPQALLMEGMRRLDEWTRLLEGMPPLDTVFEVDYHLLAERLAEMPDEVNGVLRLFDGRRTLLLVIEDSDFPDLESLSIIGKLYADRLLKVLRREIRPGFETLLPARLERWLSEPPSARSLSEMGDDLDGDQRFPEEEDTISESRRVPPETLAATPAPTPREPMRPAPGGDVIPFRAPSGPGPEAPADRAPSAPSRDDGRTAAAAAPAHDQRRGEVAAPPPAAYAPPPSHPVPPAYAQPPSQPAYAPPPSHAAPPAAYASPPHVSPPTAYAPPAYAPPAPPPAYTPPAAYSPSAPAPVYAPSAPPPAYAPPPSAPPVYAPPEPEPEAPTLRTSSRATMPGREMAVSARPSAPVAAQAPQRPTSPTPGPSQSQKMVAPAATPSQQLERSFFDGDPDTLVMALGEARRRRTAIVVGGVAISVAAVLIMIMSLRGGTKAPTAAAPVATAPAVQPPAPPPPAPAPAPQPAAAVAPPAPVPPAPAAAPPPTAAPTAAAPAKPAEVPAPAPPPPAPPVVEKPVEAPPAAAVAPEGDDLLAKCEKAYARGRGPYKAVVKACGAAIASNPRAAVPMIMIANMEFERGRYNDALQLAQRAIEIDPSIPEAYVFIGTAEQNAKRKAEARAAYEKYLQLAPTGKYARDVKMILRTL